MAGLAPSCRHHQCRSSRETTSRDGVIPHPGAGRPTSAQFGVYFRLLLRISRPRACLPGSILGRFWPRALPQALHKCCGHLCDRTMQPIYTWEHAKRLVVSTFIYQPGLLWGARAQKQAPGCKTNRFACVSYPGGGAVHGRTALSKSIDFDVRRRACSGGPRAQNRPRVAKRNNFEVSGRVRGHRVQNRPRAAKTMDFGVGG